MSFARAILTNKPASSAYASLQLKPKLAVVLLVPSAEVCMLEHLVGGRQTASVQLLDWLAGSAVVAELDRILLPHLSARRQLAFLWAARAN